MSNRQQFGPWIVQDTLKPNIAFLAYHKHSGIKGVVKIGNSIEEEAKILQQLDHPNIIKLLEYSKEGEASYMVTEYFDGRRLPPVFNKLTVRKATDLILDICEGLGYIMSKGIRVYDIEILINDQREIRFIDFGSVTENQSIKDIRKSLSEIQGKLEWAEHNVLYNPFRKRKKAELDVAPPKPLAAE